MKLWNLFRNRFPSRQALLQVFLISAFPAALWSWVIFFYDLPSFLLSLRVGQIIGILAYMQVVILIESLLIFGLVTILAVLLPRRLFLSNYVPQSALFILALAFWAVGVHLNSEQVALGNLVGNERLLYIWAAFWAAAFLALSILARYWARWNALLLAMIERLSFVSGVYLVFPLVSLPYVIIRNLTLLLS